VRRVIFIYPWVKGATLNAGQVLAEHPVQAAVYGQLAKQAEKKQASELGPVPGYAAGLFRVGGSDEFPLTVNPSSLSPLSQAAQVGRAVGGTLTGEGGSAGELFGMISPVLQAAIEASQGRDSFTGAPIKGSPAAAFVKQLAGDTAPAVFLEQFRKGNQPAGRRSFPMTREQAIARALLGGWAPRTAQRSALNERARRESGR
jgi:hypothetical protein